MEAEVLDSALACCPPVEDVGEGGCCFQVQGHPHQSPARQSPNWEAAPKLGGSPLLGLTLLCRSAWQTESTPKFLPACLPAGSHTETWGLEAQGWGLEEAEEEHSHVTKGVQGGGMGLGEMKGRRLCVLEAAGMQVPEECWAGSSILWCLPGWPAQAGTSPAEGPRAVSLQMGESSSQPGKPQDSSNADQDTRTSPHPESPGTVQNSLCHSEQGPAPQLMSGRWKRSACPCSSGYSGS